MDYEQKLAAYWANQIFTQLRKRNYHAAQVARQKAHWYRAKVISKSPEQPNA